MAIFGRITARQRLRRATQESLAIPAFSSPIDCSPWVTGGLWPAELSTITAETATLAEYLKADLQRIADSANDELKMIKRSGKADLARQAEEARVIDEARARAVRRVESTIRHLQAVKAEARRRISAPTGCPASPTRHGQDASHTRGHGGGARSSMCRPRVHLSRVGSRSRTVVTTWWWASPSRLGAQIPPMDSAAVAAPTSPIEETQVIPVVTEVEPVFDVPIESAPEPARGARRERSSPCGGGRTGSWPGRARVGSR